MTTPDIYKLRACKVLYIKAYVVGGSKFKNALGSVLLAVGGRTPVDCNVIVQCDFYIIFGL
jgi:hypothetical protein